MKLNISALAIGLAMLPAAAHSSQAVTGKLDCDVSAGIGAVIGSKKDIACTFTPSGSGPTERYVGEIADFGLDVGNITRGKLIWLVYNATADVGGLQGTYRGVAADASLGLGLGAQVLAGGSRGSIALQPASVQGDVGVNIAVGVESLSLRAAH